MNLKYLSRCGRNVRVVGRVRSLGGEEASGNTPYV